MIKGESGSALGSKSNTGPVNGLCARCYATISGCYSQITKHLELRSSALLAEGGPEWQVLAGREIESTLKPGSGVV